MHSQYTIAKYCHLERNEHVPTPSDYIVPIQIIILHKYI